jgi:hypothetical protein
VNSRAPFNVNRVTRYSMISCGDLGDLLFTDIAGSRVKLLQHKVVEVLLFGCCRMQEKELGKRYAVIENNWLTDQIEDNCTKAVIHFLFHFAQVNQLCCQFMFFISALIDVKTYSSCRPELIWVRFIAII